MRKPIDTPFLAPAEEFLELRSRIRYTDVMLRRVPLVFSPQPEGGFTVTSPVLPELITEGDTLDEAYANVSDALAAVIELYSEQGRPLPTGVDLPQNQIVWSEALVEIA